MSSSLRSEKKPVNISLRRVELRELMQNLEREQKEARDRLAQLESQLIDLESSAASASPDDTQLGKRVDLKESIEKQSRVLDRITNRLTAAMDEFMSPELALQPGAQPFHLYE